MSDITALYYSHDEPPARIGDYCRWAINVALDGLPIVAVVDPDRVGLVSDQFVNALIIGLAPGAIGHDDLTRRILRGLDFVHSDYVALCEHDVIYPAGYFAGALDVAQSVSDRWIYCGAAVHLTRSMGWRAHAEYPRSRLLSCLTARRDDLFDFFTERAEAIARGERVRVAEPSRPSCAIWSSSRPVIDIRHGSNLTGDREGRAIDRPGLRPLQALELWRELGLNE